MFVDIVENRPGLHPPDRLHGVESHQHQERFINICFGFLVLYLITAAASSAVKLEEERTMTVKTDDITSFIRKIQLNLEVNNRC